MKTRIKTRHKEIGKLFETMRKHREYFHANPELSFKEYKTSEYIRARLKEIGVPHYSVLDTGVVATIGSGERCVAFRADIDALPIQEKTGLDFASKNEGVMHACGHDMHAAMLLGAAEYLKSLENEIGGSLRLIFQPGEEKLPGGAKMIIEDGVLKNPTPEAIFAQHVNPEEDFGRISITGGPIMASSDELYWSITGKGSHAAQPHLGADAVLAASQLVVYMQTLMTKNKNPLDAATLSITSVHGGSAPNAFPEEVKLMGALRTFQNDFREKMRDLIDKRSREVCGLYDCDSSLNIVKGYPSLSNNHQASEFVKEVAIPAFGEQNVLAFEPKMWAEDFSYYAREIPACFWFLGVKTPESKKQYSLHNPHFSPDARALVYGASMFANIALEFFRK